MSRFGCPSSNLDLRGPVGKTWRVAALSAMVALAAHVSLTQWRGVAAEQGTAKPLTTHFVKRRPRLTKPLELKKRPRPRRRRIEREMVAVRARADLRQAATRVTAPRMAQGLAKPWSPFRRATRLSQAVVEPKVFAEAVQGRREAKKAVDTSLEMLDVEALDTGQYHAMIIQDPADKRSVSGFFHLHPAYSVSMRRRAWHDMDAALGRALINLAAAMNKYTDIRVDIAPQLQLDSRTLLKTPWVYVIGHAETKGFQITASESVNLGRYLTSGGFALTESVSQAAGSMVGTSWEIALRDMLRDALASQGVEYRRDWTFEPLPNSHPIYHCFFNFDGAPRCVEIWAQVVPDYLEGITLDGRIVAVHSLKDYFTAWNHRGFVTRGLDPTRIRQFGVNLLVFALTQEGSITHSLMQSVR